jgi:hypothetical protein
VVSAEASSRFKSMGKRPPAPRRRSGTCPKHGRAKCSRSETFLGERVGRAELMPPLVVVIVVPGRRRAVALQGCATSDDFFSRLDLPVRCQRSRSSGFSRGPKETQVGAGEWMSAEGPGGVRCPLTCPEPGAALAASGTLFARSRHPNRAWTSAAQLPAFAAFTGHSIHGWRLQDV